MAVMRKRTRREDQMFVEGSVPMEYLYTVGPTLEPFFKALRDKGEFHGVKCDKCGRTYIPPALFCEVCFERMEKRVKLPTHGTLECFTVAHHDSMGTVLKKPEIWGLVQLKGADTPFIHRILGDPKELKVGLLLKAKFRKKKERTGSMNDIEGFLPA